MPKKLFQRFLPHGKTLKKHPQLSAVFGDFLHDPNLWHLHRKPISGGMAAGLFTAFLPIPTQMLIAALLAILFRVNLPVAVAIVWITNPITIPPIFYSTYRLGAYLLDMEPAKIEFELSLAWAMSTFAQIWQPLLLGSLLVGSVAAILGYVLTNYLWALHVRRKWRARGARRKKYHIKPLSSPTNARFYQGDI